MVVKAYLTTGKRDRHPVIIFLMRGRSLHWHSPVTMVTVIQCSICTNTDIPLVSPWEQMIPPGRRAAFIFSKYGFSNRHLAGPVRGYYLSHYLCRYTTMPARVHSVHSMAHTPSSSPSLNPSFLPSLPISLPSPH